MINIKTIQGIVFDYGGTIDSNGLHWAEVIWQAYQAEAVPVTKDVFRQAYVHAERTMGQLPLVKPEHTFADMMRIKTDLQIEWLRENRYLSDMEASRELKRSLAGRCYIFAARSTAAARPVIEALADSYPLAMVSNFYGNLRTVLKDFRLDAYFPLLIESATVGVRKPDPQIFRLGINALKIPAAHIAVIGDSYDKDIVPAAAVGCRTVWLKNIGWKEYAGKETADAVISDFSELKTVFNLSSS
ncbi:HAD family hydrolase [Tannerella forsythia]